MQNVKYWDLSKSVSIDWQRVNVVLGGRVREICLRLLQEVLWPTVPLVKTSCTISGKLSHVKDISVVLDVVWGQLVGFPSVLVLAWGGTLSPQFRDLLLKKRFPFISFSLANSDSLQQRFSVLGGKLSGKGGGGGGGGGEGSKIGTYTAWFRACDAKQMRSALFWDIRQRTVVNVVLEKDGKDQLDWSCEKWRSLVHIY